MNLIERYLNEVRPYLPADSREDILSELRNAIEEQVADLAAEHNRAPERDDEARILARYGHPLKVAASYGRQRYLIGPELYPVFGRSLRVLLTLVLSLQLAIAMIAAATSDFTISGWQLFASLIETAFYVAAILMGVFVAIEYSGERLRWYENWRPESLRQSSVHVINRSDVITNLVSEGVFLLWWNDVLVFDNWLSALGDGYSISLSSAWHSLYWPLNVIVGAFFILHVYVLIRGLWQRSTLLTEVVLSVALLGVIGVLLTSGGLLALPADMESAFAMSLQRSATLALVVIAGFVLWDMALALRRLARPGGRQSDAKIAGEY